MKTTKRKELTPQQVEDTFAKLGLNDPRVVDYLNRMGPTPESPQQTQHWYRADSGTGLIDRTATDA